jgi:hypothetical protein
MFGLDFRHDTVLIRLYFKVPGNTVYRIKKKTRVFLKFFYLILTRKCEKIPRQKSQPVEEKMNDIVLPL